MQPHFLRALRLSAAPFIALLVLPGSAVATAQAAEATESDAWTFTTANGRRLDVQDGNTGDGVSVVANNSPGHHQNWRLIPLGRGESRAANNTTGECLSEVFPLRQQSCGKAGQEWHFRPVSGKANAFTLVRSNNDRCLDITVNAPYPEAWTQVYGCNGTKAQEWIVPASKQPEATKLATEYYARLCSTSTSTCSWKRTSEGGPQALPREKASSVWYNDTSGKVSQIFTTIYHSGWSQSFSSGVSTSVGVSTPMQAMVSAQLGAMVTYQSDETEINGVVVTVPPKQYGWGDFAAVAKKVTGTWTFAADVTTTFNLPAGSHLASYKNGAKITDADGRTMVSMLPGEVIDTRGKAHASKVSVSGNTVTQTIEDAPGKTIEGTETMPVISMSSPGFFTPPAPKRPSTASSVALRDIPVEACDENHDGRCDEAEKKKHEEKLKKAAAWDKCIAQWTIGTAITGGVAGTFLPRPGTVVGGVVGAIGGATAGMVVRSF
ncbi:RICIN domain-containing protein [Streptomyces roseoverticillatus]|uniref:RICIN domain-containing protein n=1 Tax=Streptomyces roseoverticillatus TaxID=66429 RepID=A0ABV3IX96_9ACTN